MGEWMRKSEDYARQKPASAMSTAFGLGLLASLLPIASIVGAIVSHAFTMARPLLLILGLAKICEFSSAAIKPAGRKRR